MNRRKFLFSVGATVGALAIPLGGVLADISPAFKISGITSSFMTLPTNTLGYMVRSTYDEKFAFVIDKEIISSENSVDADEFFEKTEFEIVERPELPITHQILVASNRIATKTKRGKGNHYVVEDAETVLIWYSNDIYVEPSSTLADAAFIPIKDTNRIILNSNPEDYFIRVKCDTTKIDHKLLSSWSMKRFEID